MSNEATVGLSGSKICDYCDKRGVPILPLRYAPIPEETHAPRAQEPQVPIDAQAASHYTRRLLRSGYLYVYDEARDRWSTYFVTDEAYFLKLAETPGTPPVLPSKPFNCPDEVHREIASCITIPDAKTATNVWLGFSPVQWTQRVRDLHAQATYRRRHMRCVKVNAFAASPDSAHCLGIHTVGQQVAEYAVAGSTLKKALAWSPFPANSRQPRTEKLIQVCENLTPGKGFAVVLDDPAAITTELAALMQHSFDAFVNANVRKRELSVSTAIGQIEQAVRAQARSGEEEAAEQMANEMLSQPDIGMLFPGYRQRRLANIEQVRTVTEAEAKRAENDAWKRYSSKFDEAAVKRWRQNFDTQLQAHDRTFIAPLARAHAAWMTSAALAAQFECNHDSTDAQSGIAYAKGLQLCIGSSQDKAACFDVYTKWLDGTLDDKKNLLLRALILNLDKTADEVNAAMKVSLDWRGFPLDALVGNVGKATERVGELQADALGRLIAMVLGPLSKWLTGATNGKIRPTLAVLSLHANKPFVVVEVTGGKKAFRAALIRQLIGTSGQPVTQRQMERAVAVELRRMEIAGEKLDGTEKKRFLLMLDTDKVRGMPEGLNTPQKAQWLAESIRTPQQVEQALHVEDWRLKLASPSAQMVRGGLPYVFGLVSAVLQYNAMQKLVEDDGKAMSHEKTETQQRLWAGIAALAGTIAEMSGQGLTKLASVVPRLAQQWLGFGGRLLAIGGKALGIGGTLVMAGWDFVQAAKNWREGNPGVAIAYGASGLLGLAAAALLYVGWTGWGLLVVGLLIAVAVLIEYLKDNKVQDWLERCVWGTNTAQRYRTLDEEMAQLKLATN